MQSIDYRTRSDADGRAAGRGGVVRQPLPEPAPGARRPWAAAPRPPAARARRRRVPADAGRAGRHARRRRRHRRRRDRARASTPRSSPTSPRSCARWSRSGRAGTRAWKGPTTTSSPGTACGGRCSTACRCTSPAPSPSTSTSDRCVRARRRSRRDRDASCASAGFLHLRGWLDPADMATIADDIDRAVPTYSKGDGRSWWATTNDGCRPRWCGCSTSTALADDPGDPRRPGVGPAARGARRRRRRAGAPRPRHQLHRGAHQADRRRARASPTCRGTATARSGGTPTAARARPSASR